MNPETLRRTSLIAAPLALAVLAVAPEPSRAGVEKALPQEFDARLSVGHDSNLLDASDGERASFASHDPKSFFVVSSMSDQFVEGEIRGVWRLRHFLAGRPSLRLGYLHRQYLDNPIKSGDHYALEAQARPAARTRVDVGLDFQPQIYGRHRRNNNALPGEPLFRPEVQRRSDGSADVTQGIGGSTSLKAGIEGSVRDYQAPFEARDRRLLGGSAAVSQSLPLGWRIGLGGGYRWTRSRNDPASPVDLSNREWTLSGRLKAASDRLAAALEVDLEIGWRHYTSSDPADVTHFGRDDRVAGVSVALTRELAGSLASVTRFTRGLRTANIPVGSSDDEAFSDAEIQTGILWSQSAAKGTAP